MRIRVHWELREIGCKDYRVQELRIRDVESLGTLRSDAFAWAYQWGSHCVRLDWVHGRYP